MLNKGLKNKINFLFITWFGLGKIPVAPGTAGSVGALPLCWLMSTHADLFLRFTFAVGFTALAIIGSGENQRSRPDARDPQYIVVDEVAGMLWSTLWVPATPLTFLCAFVLFRIFDVVKVFPANLFDRSSKTSLNPMRRGMHIVMDDVIAGIYSAMILQGLILYGLLPA